jgi:GT2 family glycosyltransferase
MSISQPDIPAVRDDLMHREGLTWGLVLCTYNRPDMLERCLRLVLGQDRPPIEVIVVDASADWQATRDRVSLPLAEADRDIRWHHVGAERKSSATQRNQGIRMATADILFLIDDDSLMYPGCASAVMQVYEADPEGRIQGVGISHLPPPPDRPAPGEKPGTAARSPGLVGRLAAWVRRRFEPLFYMDQLWKPYDEQYPEWELPGGLRHLPVSPAKLLNGFRMTFRRSTIEAVGFEDVLEYYAMAEDADATYRASRRGPLVMAHHAHLCHMSAPGGRLPKTTVTELFVFNLIVLHALHSTDRRRSERRLSRFLRNYAALQAGIDLARHRLSFPTARAYLRGLSWVAPIMAKSSDEIRAWYPAFQRSLIDRAINNPKAARRSDRAGAHG